MKQLLCCLLAVCGLAAGVRAVESVGIPITIEEPISSRTSGTDGLRYHLAHFGSVPYGAVFNRTVVHFFDESCICGSIKCNTGCGDFNSAQPADLCNPRIIQQGGLSGDSVNAFVLEEAEGDVSVNRCTRSTIAYNAARAYADAVIIVAGPGETELLAAVDSKSAVAQSETLKLEHVNIPVGVVTFENGTALKDAADENNGTVVLKMDYTHLFNQNNAGITIQIWHSTDDDCGPACGRVQELMSDVADMAKHLKPQDAVTVEPHFLFVNCTNDNTELCGRSCVNDRYCYERFTNLQLYGSLVAEENIRQMCLFDTLKNTESRDTRKFWFYKKYFQQNCKTNEQNFNAVCSEKAFDSIAEIQGIKEKWQSCFKNLGMPDVQKHVMKAACSAMTDDLADATVQCEEWTKGVCTPGSEADRVCRNPESASDHRQQCEEIPGESTSRCNCDPGYAMVASTAAGGGGMCTNFNECAEYPTLCNRGDLARNACQDTKGSFECKENIPNMCTAANKYGNCWSEEDLFAEYKANLQESKRGGALHKCDCESVRGCWEGGGGICTRKCPDGNCNPLTKECEEAVAAALGVSAALLVAICAGVGFLVHRRRKRSKDDTDGNTDATVGRYSHFDDGAPADRMSTGAIAMGGIQDVYPGNMATGAPAGAGSGNGSNSLVATGAAAYVARSGGRKQQQSAFAPEVVQQDQQDQFTDVALHHASLHVQEHPES